LLADAVMIPPDNAVTVIDLSASAPAQMHRASLVTDGDGTRRATLIFPAGGNTATFRMPDGSTRPGGSSLSVRASEYTVGDAGPAAMPGALPPTSAYTYAVEFTADEAQAAGAASVEFSTPLIFYLDDFLGMPPATAVPTGYYDPARGVWVAILDGDVVTVLEVVGGAAKLDTTGDGLADDGATLGVTLGERQKLAEVYTGGEVLWRVPVEHFTPWDCNFAGPPVISDAPFPEQPDPRTSAQEDLNDPSVSDGFGTIDIQNQTLHEAVSVAGTPWALHYGSEAAADHAPDRTIQISLSGPTVPAALLSIDVVIEVAGRRFTKSFPALPNQSYTFTWDGKEAPQQNLWVTVGGARETDAPGSLAFTLQTINVRSSSAFRPAANEVAEA